MHPHEILNGAHFYYYIREAGPVKLSTLYLPAKTPASPLVQIKCLYTYRDCARALFGHDVFIVHRDRSLEANLEILFEGKPVCLDCLRHDLAMRDHAAIMRGCRCPAQDPWTGT